MKSSHPSKIGRYEVVDRLGEGGMGVVYLATDPLLRRTVAVKILPGHDDELRERFAREARSVASLRHQNVVTIFDIGEDDGQPFLAMEFIDGESMAELIRRRAPLSIERRLQLIIELCAGLGYAHRNGIVHRDIKPGNLMITTEGTLKVLDFGLARMTTEGTGSGLTRAGSLMGTPHYMSPEQVHGQAVDPRSDIFSVGLVLYELLAYRKAFGGDSAHVVLHNIIHEVPAPIRDFVPDLDGDLVRIVEKGIEKHPDHRYQTLAALAAELERVRVRHAEPADTATLIKSRPNRGASAVPHAGDEPTPVGDARSRANLEAIAQRRAAAVESCVTTAAEHLAAGRYDEALAECEHAILLNPLDPRATELMAQAHGALDETQVREWLDEARARMASGALTEAQALIEQSLMLRADSAEAQALRRELRDRRTTREGAAERSRSAKAALERATKSLEAGAFEAASRSASEVLAYDGENEAALEVRRRATEAVDARRRQQQHEQWAAETVEQARLCAAADDPQAALALLEAFAPPHALVSDALNRLRARLSIAPPPGQVGRSRQATGTVAAEEVAATLVVERPKSARPRGGRTTAPVAVTDRPAPRRTSAILWAGAAAGLLVVAGGIWFVTRAPGPEATTATAPPVPPEEAATTQTTREGPTERSEPGGVGPAPPAENAEVGRVHTTVIDALGRNSLDQAALVIMGAPPDVRQHPTLLADMDRLLAAARRRAADTFAQAQKVPGARASAAYGSAQLRRTEATVLERNGQLLEAAQGFIAAAELFVRAIPAKEQANTVSAEAARRSEPAKPAPPAPQEAPPEVTTPAVATPPPPVTGTGTTTAAAPPPPSGPAPPVTPAPTAPSTAPADAMATDTAAIREALTQYIAGYERLDVGAIRRIYPTAPANLDLSNVRSYRLALENVEITVQGERATVTATRRVRAQMKAGSIQEPTLPTEFSLRRAASGWLIERVR